MSYASYAGHLAATVAEDFQRHGIVAPSPFPADSILTFTRESKAEGRTRRRYLLQWRNPITGDTIGAVGGGGFLGTTAREATLSLEGLHQAFALLPDAPAKSWSDRFPSPLAA